MMTSLLMSWSFSKFNPFFPSRSPNCPFVHSLSLKPKPINLKCEISLTDLPLTPATIQKSPAKWTPSNHQKLPAKQSPAGPPPARPLPSLFSLLLISPSLTSPRNLTFKYEFLLRPPSIVLPSSLPVLLPPVLPTTSHLRFSRSRRLSSMASTTVAAVILVPPMLPCFPTTISVFSTIFFLLFFSWLGVFFSPTQAAGGLVHHHFRCTPGSYGLQVRSLATGRLLRNVTFPFVINAIAIDDGEYAFYAGGRDGKIYIAALNAVTTCSADYGKHIIGLLPDSSRAVSSLAFCADGISLVSGSEDGKIRIWDTRTRNIVRMFTHSKGPVTNILVTSLPESASRSQATSARKTSILPPPLEKYANSSKEPVGTKVFIGGDISSHPVGVSYLTEEVMNRQIKQMQQQGSTIAAEMEAERLKLDINRAMQMAQQWKQKFDILHQFCVDELVDDGRAEHSDVNSG